VEYNALGEGTNKRASWLQIPIPKEGEGRLSSFEVFTVKCASLSPSKAKEKKLWIENWLEELELV
jgi:hypothetical protein